MTAAGAEPLVGRGIELRAVEDALDAGRTVVVSGVAGVGKTRLARAALAAAAGRGAHTRWATASHSARAIPLGALAGLVPPRLPEARMTPEALLEAIVECLADEATTPVVVVVDDAHLLDDPSAALVRLLAARERTAVVLTLRAGADVPDAIGGLVRDGSVERIDVQELTEPDVADLLPALLRGPVDRATVRRLWSVTRGNPLFLCELVRTLRAAGSLAQRSGWWRWSGSFPHGTTSGSLIAERTRDLDDDARAALVLVAFGEPLELATLERLVTAEVVAHLERGGLIEVTTEPGRDEVGTAHPLYGEAVRASTPVSQARQVRRMLARAIADQPDVSPSDRLRAAGWQLENGEEVEPRLILDATRRAWVVGDPGLAERLARRGLARGDDPELRYLLAEAVADLGRFEEAIAAWDGIGPDASDAVRVAAACSRAQVTGFVLDRFPEAIAVLDAVGPIDDPEAAAKLVAVRAVLATQGGVADDRGGAEALLAEEHCPETELWALLATLPTELVAGRIERVESQLGRARAAAAAADAVMPNGSMWVELVAYFVELFQGRLDAAETMAREHLDASLVPAHPLARGLWTQSLGVVALHRGRPRTAAALFEEAGTHHRDYAAGLLQGSLLGLALARALAGDAVGASAALDAADAEERGAPFEAVDRGRAEVWCRVAAGETTGAARLALRAASDARRRHHAVHELTLLHDAARLGEARGARQRAVALGAAIDGPWATAVAAHVTGLALGDVAALSTAAEAFETQGALLEAMEAWHAAARTAAARGRSSTAHACGRRAEALRGACAEAHTPGMAARGWDDPLTTREREVAGLAAGGLTDKEVAGRLEISTRTVHAHLRAVYAKLGITGRGDLDGVVGPPGVVAASSG